MSKTIDYKQIIMGVPQKKLENYYLSFIEEERLASLTQVIPKIKGKMLDIGCGGGAITESLPYYYPNADIHGCDISKAAIKYAEKLGTGKIKYSLAQEKKFPYKDNFFDVCICFDVVEHIPHVENFLKEIRRVLKKRGKFFLVVPCEGQAFTYTWLFRKIKFGQNLTLDNWGHIHPEFTHDSVAMLLAKQGFAIEKKVYSAHFLYQIIVLLTYWFPKLFLERIIGKERAKKYSDVSVSRVAPSKKDPLFYLRKISLMASRLGQYPKYWETSAFRKFPVSAYKLHVLSRKS